MLPAMLVSSRHSRGVAPAGGGGEREQLLEQRTQLQREASSLQLAVAQLETDVSRTRKDIARVGEWRSLVEGLLVPCPDLQVQV